MLRFFGLASRDRKSSTEMPPAISDGEQSQSEDDLRVPVRTKAVASSPVDTPTSRRQATTVASAARNRSKAPSKAAPQPKADEEEEEEEGEESDEDLEEDEYVVEKIMSHMVYPDGTLKFEVKWEGYDKKADRTWESKDNLVENASDILTEYLQAHGGEDKILEESEKGVKGKKRGRPAASVPAAGKRRKGDHPSDSTPPATTKAWKPPAGSWEDEVQSIDACHDENSGKLIVYLTWKNGQKTQHETKVIYQRCPQKMLAFYERHVKIV